MNALASETAAFQQWDFDHGNSGSLVQGSFQLRRRRVESDSSPWNAELSERFDQICSLRPGWDGYTGIPVSFGCAHFAAAILKHLFTTGLPAPSLVPGSDGSVQIEWHRNQYDIELDVLEPNKVVAYRYDHLSQEEDGIDVSNDFTLVSEWLKDCLLYTSPSPRDS